MLGQPFAITFTPQDRAAGEPEREVAAAERDGVASDVRWHNRKDGSRVFIHGSVTPLRNEEGAVRGYLKIGQDITARKQAEEHQRLLLAELQHRVRNTLGVIRSIARRTAENSANVEDMSAHLEGRIDAFARVQAMATRATNGTIDLATLIEDELLAHAAHDGEQATVKGPEIQLAAKPAELLSLAIHELATNAVKYGALGHNGARVAVSWTLDDGHLDFVWQEAGVPGGIKEPDHEGFGLELLRRVIPYELEAETNVDFRTKGLRFKLTMPIAPNDH
jgi:two-component system CheB/CheR fusion protein